MPSERRMKSKRSLRVTDKREFLVLSLRITLFIVDSLLWQHVSPLYT